MVLTSVPKAIKGANVSEKTCSNRNNFIKSQLQLATGGGKQAMINQTSKLITSLTPDDKNKILKKAKIASTDISAEAMVAMKANLGIPWEKLIKLGR